MRKNVIMIFLTVFVLSLVSVFDYAEEKKAGAELTAPQVIDKCAEALGGKSKIKALQTMRLKVTYPGHAHEITTEIMRPNLIRNTNSVDFILTFDGKRAGYLKRDPKRKGPMLIPQEELKDFELEVALVFPSFFDYKAVYKGIEKVDGINAHKLYVKLPLGAQLTYYIDAESFLPHKVVSTVIIKEKTYYPTRIYKDYKKVSGILYPQSFIYSFRKDEEKKRAVVNSVEFNVKIDQSHFALPKGIK